MYHNIANNPQDQNDTIDPANFEKQLQFLKNNGYHVLRLDELVAGIEKKRPLPRHSVVLTFDDGHENNFTNAFPLLKHYHMTAIFFIPAAEVGKPGNMTWEQLEVMAGDGMAIGSHGTTAAYLPDLTKAQQHSEIFESKKILEAHLQVPVDFYAYSVGGFSLPVKAMIRQAGYRAALTTNRGTSRQLDIFELRRVKMMDKNISASILRMKLSGYYNLFRTLRKPQ